MIVCSFKPKKKIIHCQGFVSILSKLTRLYHYCSSLIVKKEENNLVKDKDLKHLWHLVERRDGGPPWKHMMDCSTPNMHYQAWQRDPEVHFLSSCSSVT